MHALNFARTSLPGDDQVQFYSLSALEREGWGDFSRFPYAVRILLESLVRMQGHPAYTGEQVQALCAWQARPQQRSELPFMPARVLLQDFTGVPCVVDLAALRDAMSRAGGRPETIEPQIPVDLVVDHSIQLDEAGGPGALAANVALEFQRNTERYRFLKWGQQAFGKLRVLPPGLGICHQINMEYLARCVEVRDGVAFPDTLVGTDSHTTTINCMGVLGWGVGGIEAEAAMLGQPIPILTPEVVGFELTGRLRPGVTATDLALTVTQMLRARGVVEKMVEFHGEGAAALSLADRCPVANMAPEYGATLGFFPVDEQTLAYLRQTGRSAEHCRLVEVYCKEQGLWRQEVACADYTDRLCLDLETVEPCVAGPRRPHERLTLPAVPSTVPSPAAGETREKETAASSLGEGSVVIAGITSCTNTSNPALLLGAALVARHAVARGLRVPGHVRTSFAPGSQAAVACLRAAGLLEPLEQLGFHVAAYGCATCIGNSGPCAPEIDQAIREQGLTVAAVLSGNRNFEGRIYPLTRLNYLASPALVVAYALAGHVRLDLSRDPIGQDSEGRDVYLKDIWYGEEELRALCERVVDERSFKEVYARPDEANERWNDLEAAPGHCFDWDAESTYIQPPPFFDEFTVREPDIKPVEHARVLACFGDFITTDHISPAGTIPPDGPAGSYLLDRGVAQAAFNSFGSRRGNHEVMMRGTFANIRIRNRLVAEEGGRTLHFPGGESMSFYEAAMQYRQEGVPLVVLAGQMYGAGSSRDWAAKGTRLLGVRAVIAQSFERIHRSNLVEMGVLPLEFLDGQHVEQLGLTGHETYTLPDLASMQPGAQLEVRVKDGSGERTFLVKSRIDTPIELLYFRHGGILPYVLRHMLADQGGASATDA